jgi:hypothetical protein
MHGEKCRYNHRRYLAHTAQARSVRSVDTDCVLWPRGKYRLVRLQPRDHNSITCRAGSCMVASMPIRIRKLIGAFALFTLVVVWALLAMALAQSVLTSTTGWIAAFYYVVAGLGWVLLAMPLIRWMSRPDAPAR